MTFLRGGLEKADFLRIYEALLVPRIIEERMLLLLRQNKLSKWFAGIGQEAIAVGSTLALKDDEYILPLHRNLGVFTARAVPYARLFAQFRGAASGYTKGRDRSFHFGTQDHHIVGMISHLGAQLAVADGIALAAKLRKENKVVLVFCGEGATSQGDFHEALNVAAVWQLPVIFLVENNGYGLSTPIEEQYACQDLVDKGLGYGIEARKIDGNNVLSVYHNVRYYADRMRKASAPVLIEAITFRMRGHEEASGTAYVPKKLTKYWAARDPIAQYTLWLEQEDMLSETYKAAVHKRINAEISEAIATAFTEKLPVAHSATEHKDVYAPSEPRLLSPASHRLHKLRFIDAIREGLIQGMEQNDQTLLMGQDIATYGGVFKVTEGLLKRFGPDRVRNTPLCESGVLGAALGLAIQGMRPIVEMQFADFVSCGFNQIINNWAKLYYRWGQSAGILLRLPTGAGVGAGPFHSQSTEAWFFHTPGLKILYPATVQDAKGLLLAALQDPNPCLFFEHKALYRSLSEEIPVDPYTVEIGKAACAREGTEGTIITYGMGLHWALQAVEAANYDVEIIDLRSLLPWDRAAVAASLRKTHRALVLHEACLTGGVGAEIAAWIGEHCFEDLDAPVMRLGAWDTPVPYAGSLEKAFLPKDRLQKRLEQLIQY